MLDQDAPIAGYSLRAVAEWRGFGTLAKQTWNLVDALDLDVAQGEASEDWGALLAAIDLGLRFAPIVREPAYCVKPEKAARDAALDRATMHLAPLWRHPLSGALGQPAEAGDAALILPVSARGEALSLSRLGDEEFINSIADLVAIPLDGGRPLSLTGYTVSVGPFSADDGRLVVYGSGRAWLDRHLANVLAICADTPGHLVEQLHMPFAPPQGTLVIEPSALEWRIARYDCVIPHDASEIVCPDSRKLAQLIDQAMRKKEKVRPLPTVRGPRANERVAA